MQTRAQAVKRLKTRRTSEAKNSKSNVSVGEGSSNGGRRTFVSKTRRTSEAKNSKSNVSVGEGSSNGGRRTFVSNTSINVPLEEMDPRSGKKEENRLLQSSMQRASKFRASQSHFLCSSSEEGRLLHEGDSIHLSKLAISSAERLSDSLQLTCIDRTQILHDTSSTFKDSSIKLNVSQVQQLNSLQASAGKLDIPPTILDNTVNLTNIKMPKGFHKYLEETPSIAKTSSEQDTLEERSHHSTFESQPASSPSPSKPSNKGRYKEKYENQQFQDVFDNDSKQQTFTDSLPSHKADLSQNTTLSTPLASQPFGRKRSKSIGEAEYDNVLAHLSTTFSPRKYSSKIGEIDLSQQSISVTPQVVQPFGERRKRIENEDKFEDALSQPSLRLCPRNSAARIGEVSQQSISKSPQAMQPFGKRQKRLQIEDNFEDTLSQSPPRLSPKKSISKIVEISQSSISKSPPSLKPFGGRKKRLQNEDNFEDILSQSISRTSPRKLDSKTDKLSERSISISPQAVKPFGKRQKRLQIEDNFEDTLSQSPPRSSPKKSISKIVEISQSSISKSPPSLKPFGGRKKRLQNEDNFEDILSQSISRTSPRKLDSKTDKLSERSISISPQAVKPFGKRQKSLQNDNFENISDQSSPRLTLRKSKTGEVSQSSISKSPQALQPFHKRQKRLQNEDKFEEILKQTSPGLSTRKHSAQVVQSFDKRQKREKTEGTLHQSSVRLSPNKSAIRTEKVSQESISTTLEAVQPFDKRQKTTQGEVNFKDILNESSPILSPRKSNSKIGEVSCNNITESSPSAQSFNELQKRKQREDNFEDTVSQSSPRTSLRKLNSKTGKVSQSSISKSPQAIQPFGKRQKRLQNDNCEDTINQSSLRTSPRKFNSKTGDVSQSSISKLPQAAQPFDERQERIQNVESFEDVLSSSSPRKSSSKTGELPVNSISESPPTAQLFSQTQKKIQNEDHIQDYSRLSSRRLSPRKLSLRTREVLQDNISESPSVIKLYGKTQKIIQNEDSFEDIASQPSPRKSVTTGEVLKNSFCEPVSAIQPFGKRLKTAQNENNFEDVLSQPSPRLSPGKSSSRFKEISESSQVVKSFADRERRTQENAILENKVDAPSPKQIASKSAPEYTEASNAVSQPDITQSVNKGENFENALEHSSFKMPSGKYLRSSVETNKESLENENQSSKTTRHITAQKDDEGNLSDCLEHSSPIEIFRDDKNSMKRSDKCVSVINADSSHRLNTRTQLKVIAEHRDSTENLLTGDLELQKNVGSHNKQRKSVLKHSVTPIHGDMFDPNCLESENSLRMNKVQNNSSKNYVDSEMNSPFTFTFHKVSESYVSQKNTSNICRASNVPPMLTQTLDDNLKESIDSIKNSGKHHLENLKGISYISKVSEEHCKGNITHTSEKQENALQKIREMVPLQDGVDTVLNGALQRSSQHTNSSQGHSNSALNISSKLQSSHLQVLREGSTAGHSSDGNESDDGSSMLEVQSAIVQKDDSSEKKSKKNAGEREKNLDAGYKLQTSAHFRVSLEHKRNADPFHENRSEVSGQSKKGHPVTTEVLREDSKKLSEELPIKQRQKHKDLNVLAYEEAFRAASMSSQESIVESITSEQQGDKLPANQELAICLRESIMRNQNQLSHCTLTKDNGIPNPRNISNQMLLAEKHLIPNLELDSPTAKLHHLSIQKDTRANLQGLPKCTTTLKETVYATTDEHAWEAGTIKSHDSQFHNSEPESQKFNAAHSEVQQTEIIEMVRRDGLEQSNKRPEPLTASHVFQNTSWRSFNSARMDSSASSVKSTTDDSLYLRLKTKCKRYRKLSQLKKFHGETSDSSNVSKNMGAERPTFVRKRKHSLNSYNGLIPTKHIANTESRSVAHNISSAVASVILADAENEIQNVTGCIVADSNMAEYLNTEDVIHTRIEDEHRKEREYQQSSTKQLNCAGLDSNASKSGSKVKIDLGLFKSRLERRAHGQKQPTKIENHDKQLKMPLYHQQWTRENEPHKLYLALKCIAEGNIHQDKTLEDKDVVQPTAVKTKAQQIVKKNRKTNPALIVNGKVYRAPRLARPKQWVNKRLYDHIMPAIAAKYGEANSRTKAEEYVTYLCHQVSTVVRRKNYNNYRSNLEKIKKSLYNLGLIKCYNDYFIFIEKYLPFEFRYKAIPCIRAFGKHTGPPWFKGINILADLGY